MEYHPHLYALHPLHFPELGAWAHVLPAFEMVSQGSWWQPLVWGKEVWGEVLRHRRLKVGPEVRHSGCLMCKDILRAPGRHSAYHSPSLEAILKNGKDRWQDWDRSGEALTAQAHALDRTCSAPGISLSSCHTRVTPSSLNTWAISPQPGRRLLGMFSDPWGSADPSPCCRHSHHHMGLLQNCR